MISRPRVYDAPMDDDGAQARRAGALSARERFVLEQRYRMRTPAATLAAHLGVHPSRIRQIEQDAVLRLLNALEPGAGDRRQASGDS